VFSSELGQNIDERALPHSGRAGEAHDLGGAFVPEYAGQQLARFGLIVFDQSQSPRNRTRLSLTEALYQVLEIQAKSI